MVDEARALSVLLASPVSLEVRAAGRVSESSKQRIKASRHLAFRTPSPAVALRYK